MHFFNFVFRFRISVKFCVFGTHIDLLAKITFLLFFSALYSSFLWFCLGREGDIFSKMPTYSGQFASLSVLSIVSILGHADTPCTGATVLTAADAPGGPRATGPLLNTCQKLQDLPFLPLTRCERFFFYANVLLILNKTIVKCIKKNIYV